MDILKSNRNWNILLLVCALLLLRLGISYSQNSCELFVYFETDSYELTKINKQKLRLFSDTIKHYGRVNKISINGFCDDRDDVDYNQELSRKRAMEVYYYLINLGVDKLLFNRVQGNGEIGLTEKSNISFQREMNRRVEIKLLKTSIYTSFNDTLKKGDKIILPKIHFYPGKSDVLPESHKYIDSLFNKIKEYPRIIFQIQGHIYRPGYSDTTPYFLGTNVLSERRARRIYDYLIYKGIEKSRLSYLGFEGKYPLGREPKLDRRIEVEVIGFLEN